MNLPDMHAITLKFDAPRALDPVEKLKQHWLKQNLNDLPAPGSSIAVCVGSRGIANLAAIVKWTVDTLKGCGCRPFITPAMGSHGGATPEGQKAVLADLGITEPAMGVPIRATMAVKDLEPDSRTRLYTDTLALSADGIVVINRVKQHTDFSGPIESGPMKMLVIGLGNHTGADYCHRLAMEQGLGSVILTLGRKLIHRLPLLFGIALVENENHETVAAEICLPHQMEAMEKRLLKQARACLPTLPFDRIDLLIVDEMGKNISGAGLDPNVIGRNGCSWSSAPTATAISRIIVRDLTYASHGNAAGLSMVDFVTQKLYDKIDRKATITNALTACCPEDGKLPISFATDREAVMASLDTIRPFTRPDLTVVHIKNTLDLAVMEVSTACLTMLTGPGTLVSEKQKALGPLSFDNSGTLVSTL